MNRSQRVVMFVFCAVALCAPGCVIAEDVSIVINKQITEIARLGSNPQASDADKKTLQDLYQAVQSQGPNAVPVIEEILRSKGNAAQKQVSLYLASLMFAPRTVEETATRGKMLTNFIKLGLADEAEVVRGYALQMAGGMADGLWKGESYYMLRDFYQREKNPQMRVYALSKIAGFMIDEAYTLISNAANDPDPQVQQAARSYKDYQDNLRAIRAGQAAQAVPALDKSQVKGYGKNAN